MNRYLPLLIGRASDATSAICFAPTTAFGRNQPLAWLYIQRLVITQCGHWFRLVLEHEANNH